MAIERMALVSIEGTLKKVNRTLMQCCESEYFHIIESSHTAAADYSSQSFKTLKDRNPFAPLVRRGAALAKGLGIKLDHQDYSDIDYAVGVDFSHYFSEIEATYSDLAKKTAETKSLMEQHERVLDQVEHLAGLSSNFQEIFSLKYIKVRFGRLPADSFEKVKFFEDRTFLFCPFEKSNDYIWGVYFAPAEEGVIVDDIFKSLYFERVRMPDYLSGTADDAKSYLLRSIRKEKAEIRKIKIEISKLRDDVEEKFKKVFSKLTALNSSYEYRGKVSIINNRFFLSGYVPRKRAEEFVRSIEKEDAVKAQIMPFESDPASGPPVRLKNNRIFRPFEMFVSMYGLPEYGNIDPTPFVAITYIIIYGIMFGDLGQGLFISALGILLSKLTKAKLAPIITRLGISSALFGFFIYGSVFGNEELIQPIFRRSEIYSLAGLSHPPDNMFEISSLLLIASLAIGIILILISMILNVISCARSHDFEAGILGPSGINGFLLYASLVIGLVMDFGLGYNVFTPAYVIGFIVIPVLILLFKGQIAHAMYFAEKKTYGYKINKNTAFVHAIKSYSNSASDVNPIQGGEYDLERLIECKYIKSQYGALSVEGYEKLVLFEERRFHFFPFESDGMTISGVYLAPKDDFPGIDKLFSSLGFIKEKMPGHIGEVKKEIRKLSEGEFSEHKEERKSVGNFLIEGIIELFESGLTYVTNTMSFLRIGGFVLSHAGLMLVVNILAEKAGSPGSAGWIIAMVIGNLFVIGMEGFLVGIQVLRLEFYEMFSRFYRSGGKPFKPISADIQIDS